VALDRRFIRPWPLPENRVRRFYTGSGQLEAFRDRPGLGGRDGRPEDWVGSTTRTWTPPGAPLTDEGLSETELGGARLRVLDLLREDPVAVAGPHGSTAGGAPTTGVLVKLLDAGVRLPVHCHPSRDFASRVLGAPFGKAEAWIVLRTVAGLDAHGPGVYIGFNRDFRREELIHAIEGENTEVLLGAMHHRPTGPGDVWFIPPGTPHAIGAGVFMVEVQEPTDFSIVAETRGLPIDPTASHLGLGWDIAIDAFDRSAHDEAWLDGLRHDGRRSAQSGPGWRAEPLTEQSADMFFRAERLRVEGTAQPGYRPSTYAVAVVTDGEGSIRAGSGDVQVRRGETFALPAAALGNLVIKAPAGLELVVCRPPDPDR
jgi:mannose-6-phosphate isomerase